MSCLQWTVVRTHVTQRRKGSDHCKEMTFQGQLGFSKEMGDVEEEFVCAAAPR